MAPAPHESPTAVYVARQPILDARGRVFGYELLYRGSPTDTACSIIPDVASASVITSAVLDLGLDTLTDARLAFLNVTAPLVIEQIDGLVRPEEVVLELLETIEVTEEVVTACKRLRSHGYRLALDDFIPGSRAEALLAYASFVKVDMLATSIDDAVTLAARLKASDITMVAEKVETHQVYEHVCAAGYTLFQGYYFCKPVIQAGAAIPAHQMVYLRLLAALTNPNLGMLELEALVKQDVSLSHRVLRFVNSAAVPVRTEVRTIHQALLLIGMEPIRKWASVWYLAGLNQKATPELATLALVRARACELLGARAPHLDASELFLVGLFSLLDVMLSRSMVDAVGNLPLSAASAEALVGRLNPYRLALDAVTAFEGGAWDAASNAAVGAGVDAARLPEAYRGALRWAREVTRGGAISSHSP